MVKTDVRMWLRWVRVRMSLSPLVTVWIDPSSVLAATATGSPPACPAAPRWRNPSRWPRRLKSPAEIRLLPFSLTAIRTTTAERQPTDADSASLKLAGCETVNSDGAELAKSARNTTQKCGQNARFNLNSCFKSGCAWLSFDMRIWQWD